MVPTDISHLALLWYIYIFSSSSMMCLTFLFRKVKHITVDDEELKEIFPKGVSHFQVSERRGSKKY